MITTSTLLQVIGFLIVIAIEAAYFLQRLSKVETLVEERTKELKREMDNYAKLEERFLESHKELHEKIDHQNEKMIDQNKKITELVHGTNLILTELKTQFGAFTEAFKEFKQDIRNA